MKKPKRIRFVSSQRSQKQAQQLAAGLGALLGSIRTVAQAVGASLESLRHAVVAAEKLGTAIMNDPEFQQEAKMQNLYYQSWQRNELTDTLANAGISL